LKSERIVRGGLKFEKKKIEFWKVCKNTLNEVKLAKVKYLPSIKFIYFLFFGRGE
jgi:hypothetical protein